MANPVYVDCPKNTWTKAATAVKTGTIHTVETTCYGPTYIWCRVDTGTQDVWNLGATPADDTWNRLPSPADLVNPDISANRAAAVLAGKVLFLDTFTVPHINMTDGADNERVYLDKNNSMNVSESSDLWIYATPFDGRVLVDMV
jgi:hypothetical protein